MHSDSKGDKRDGGRRKVRILLAAMSVVALSNTPVQAFNLLGAPWDGATDLRLALGSKESDREAEDKDRNRGGQDNDSGGKSDSDSRRSSGGDSRDGDKNSNRNSNDEDRGWDRPGKSGSGDHAEHSRHSSTDPFAAGDTAISAGKYLEAFQIFRDEAGKLSQAGKSDNGTLALLYERLGNAARLAGKYSDAETALKQASGHCGTDRALAKVKVRVLFELADLLSFEGLPIDASVVVDQAFKASSSPGDRPASLDAELHLLNARFLTEQCKLTDAEKEIQTVLRLLETMGEPSTRELPPMLPLSSSKENLAGKVAANRAVLARLSGNVAAASKFEAEAAAKLESSNGPGGAAHVDDHRYLPEVLKLRSQMMNMTAAQAKSRYERALGTVPATAPGYAKAALMLEYGAYQVDAEDFKGAEATFKGAADTLSKCAPARSNVVCQTHLGLAESYLNSAKVKSAAASALIAYSKLERTNGLDSKAFADSAATLGRAYVAAGKYETGQTNLHKAIRIYDKTIGKGTYERARAAESLAVVYLRNRQYQAAIDLASGSLATEEKLLGTNNPRLVVNLTTLGNANAKLKKYADADRQLNRAQSILLSSGKADTPAHAEVITGLGINAGLQKKWKPAEADFKRAMAIYAKTQGPRSGGVVSTAQLLKTLREMRDGGEPITHNLLLRGNFVPRKPDQQQ